MAAEIDELTELAYEGGAALTTTPVIGSPSREYAPTLVVGAEPLGAGEIRVTVLGSGDPFVKKSQASASLLIEVGNDDHDFFFDLGSGALANFNGLRLPVTATTKVFLTHLHADHVGDVPHAPRDDGTFAPDPNVYGEARIGRRGAEPVPTW